MENPELFDLSNLIARYGAETVLNECWSQLSWSEDNERVLDIGSGSGNVTFGILLSRLPAHATVIGIDISLKMVEYASKKFSSDRLKFKVLDFLSPDITDVLGKNKFSKVFSSYSLQLLPDQKQAAKNNFVLLRNNGQCLHVMLSPNDPLYKVYNYLRQMDRWTLLMKDMDKIHYLSTKACEDIKRIWTTEGFDILKCEERQKTFTFQNMRSFLNLAEAVNPFVRLLDEVAKALYMKDFERIVDENKFVRKTPSGEVLYQSCYIVVHGIRLG